MWHHNNMMHRHTSVTFSDSGNFLQKERIFERFFSALGFGFEENKIILSSCFNSSRWKLRCFSLAYPSLIFCLHAIDLLAVRAKRKEPLHKIGWKLLKYYRHGCAVPTEWVEILFENIFLHLCFQ